MGDSLSQPSYRQFHAKIFFVCFVSRFYYMGKKFLLAYCLLCALQKIHCGKRNDFFCPGFWIMFGKQAYNFTKFIGNLYLNIRQYGDAVDSIVHSVGYMGGDEEKIHKSLSIIDCSIVASLVYILYIIMGTEKERVRKPITVS